MNTPDAVRNVRIPNVTSQSQISSILNSGYDVTFRRQETSIEIESRVRIDEANSKYVRTIVAVLVGLAVLFYLFGIVLSFAILFLSTSSIRLSCATGIITTLFTCLTGLITYLIGLSLRKNKSHDI